MNSASMIYVDFSIRDLDGRIYVARLDDFDHTPDLGERFSATDHEEFIGVECMVIAIDRTSGRVYHRPVDPSEVPGSYEAPEYSGASREQVQDATVEQSVLVHA